MRRIRAQRDTFAYHIAAEDDQYFSDKKKNYFGDSPDSEVNPLGSSGTSSTGLSGDSHYEEMASEEANRGGYKAPKQQVVPGVPSGYSGYGGGSSGGGSPSSYTPSQGVDQWKSQVDEGLRRNGLPTTLDSQVLKQIQTESAGNPTAINNTDSNAQAGHPSQGLLQTIPSTFQQYHYQGDSNSITDPQANIDSAIGYAKSRYGPTLMDSSGNGMGSGHGY